jgi:hypothetical protein
MAALDSRSNHMGLVVGKRWHSCRYSLSTTIWPNNSHSTKRCVFFNHYIIYAIHNEVSWGVMLQSRSSRDLFPMKTKDFKIGLIFPASLCPRDRLSFQQKWVPRISLWVKGGCCMRLISSPPSVSRLPRRCGNLDVSQAYWLLLSVIGKVLFFSTA